MTTFSTSIAASSMILQDDGIYRGTLLASTHGLGTSVFVVRAVARNSDLSQENVICAYQVDTNGDIHVYTDEPTTIRITVGCYAS